MQAYKRIRPSARHAYGFVGFFRNAFGFDQNKDFVRAVHFSDVRKRYFRNAGDKPDNRVAPA